MKRLLIVIPGLAVVALLLLGWGIFGDQSSFHTGLSQYEGLPVAASDITVYRNRNISGSFIADFKIREPDLVSYAREKHWDLAQITRAVAVSQATAFHDRRPNDKKEISSGLIYSQRAPNGGGITVAYDRGSGRAFIDRSSR